MRRAELLTVLLISACAHRTSADFVREHYTKSEYRIPMRDGVELFTAVYVPKDASDAKRYPILLKRTPFSVAPYGDAYAKLVGPNAYVMRDQYIFVYQDIRGRYMSGGKFVMMRPYVADSISEASDAHDTISWLLAHVPHNNGRVGAWGTSYAGFLATMAALSHHPALVVASPQAPATDSYFEDFHHNGALTQGYFYAYPFFGIYPPGPTTSDWWVSKLISDGTTANDYAFQLALGPLENTTEKYYKDNWFWQDIVAHPNYDAYWQSRAVPPVLTGVRSAMLIAGGWFDAENLYGTLATYKTLIRQDTAAKVTLVMGPFRHNGWEATKVADSLAVKFQRDIEAPYFRAYLKGDGTIDLPAALLFDTGRKQWRGEIMRARFRQSFAAPQPMRPDAITPVSFPLQDVLHTFRIGHRIMIQVQSSWFPAFDRNPQKYAPNIYQAHPSDFVKATERIWVDRAEPSYLEVQVVPAQRDSTR